MSDELVNVTIDGVTVAVPKGTPIIEAQAMPTPIIGIKAMYWLSIRASQTSASAARPRAARRVTNGEVIGFSLVG